MIAQDKYSLQYDDIQLEYQDKYTIISLLIIDFISNHRYTKFIFQSPKPRSSRAVSNSPSMTR